MKRFSSEFIEQVRQANDIVSVISDYVTLKRQGRNFWACCPFHNEKTASFSVAADKDSFIALAAMLTAMSSNSL